MMNVLVSVLLATLVYALCLVLGLPNVVGIVAALLVLVSGVGTGDDALGRRGERL